MIREFITVHKPLTKKKVKALLKEWRLQYGGKRKLSIWKRFTNWLLGIKFYSVDIKEGTVK